MQDATPRDDAGDAARLFFACSPVPMWLYDLETLAFLEVNDAAVAKYGYSRDEFLAMTIADIRPPEDVERLKACVAEEPPGYAEAGVWRHRAKDGSIRLVEISSHAATFKGRKAELVAAVDVTGREEARRAAEEKAALLQYALGVARMGWWTLDERTGQVFWSPETLAMFGLTEEEFGGDFGKFMELVLPEEREAAIEAGHAARRSTAPYEFEYRIRRPDGEVRTMRHRAHMERDAAGAPLRQVGVVMDVTDARRREQELRDQAALLEMASAINRMGAWEVDLPPTKVFWSDMTRVIHEAPEGYEPAVPDAISFYEPEFRPVIAEAFRRCVEEGAPYEVEARIRTMKGNIVPVMTRGRAVRDESGRIVRVLGAFQDLTERKDAMRRLAESEARFRGLLDKVPTVAVQAYDARGCVTYWNKASERLYGWTAEEAMGRGLLDLIIPEGLREVVAKDIAAMAAGGEPSPAGELLLRRKDGAPVAVFSSHAVVRRPDGEPEMFCMDMDLTESKAAERALAESERRFRAIASCTVDAIWDWDLASDAIWWNEAMGTVFGHEFGGATTAAEGWLELIHPEDRERVEEEVRAVIEGAGGRWRGEYRLRRGDGTYAVVDDRGTVLRGADGAAVRMVGGMADITERLALERQLAAAQRMQSIGQLTGGMAHDFNNLLTVILGNAELLEDVLEGDEANRRLARMIVDSASRGAALTHSLLAYARKQPLQPTLLCPNDLVSGMDTILSRALGGNIEVESIRSAGLWSVRADRAQLQSALLNLCLNARDAMPRGGRLTIETANVSISSEYAATHEEVRPGQYAMIAVTDTGCGIPKQDIDRIFEPFYTTKEEGKGTGLGLSMVYGFVKQSRGHIKAYSEVGEGTTIRVYLPRAKATEEERRATPQLAAAGGDEVILLVEDDELVRKYAKAQVDALGYPVVVASNGREALRFLEEGMAVDLLFTDIVMPGGMDGRQLADAARDLRPGLKVLYTSGYTENAIVHNDRVDEDAILLSKPYTRTQLAQKIREALAQGDPPQGDPPQA